MQRKGLDKMPYGVSQNEVVARLAFGCDFDTASAFEQSRIALWWANQTWFTRLRLWLMARMR
jgi:hypothetical protein